MKLLNIQLLTVLLITMSFKQKATIKEISSESSKYKNNVAVQVKEISKECKLWLDAVKNKNLENIKNSYAENAIKIISIDSTINDSERIANYYINQSDKITSIESIFRIEANENRGIDYELVRFKTEKLKEYIQLVIWKLEGERKVREFEYTVKSNLKISEIYTKNISEQRGLWIQLCNKNNAENLVKRLYSKNAFYFNHKPLIKGTENLIKEYAYMNNDNYSLALQPLKIEPVNENTVFEIGQCNGSYGGKYILVWKKESDGKWKIFIDSNI